MIYDQYKCYGKSHFSLDLTLSSSLVSSLVSLAGIGEDSVFCLILYSVVATHAVIGL